MNLKIKIKKLTFYIKNLNFLKYILLLKEILMDFKKVKIILNWPTLINIKKL